MNPSWAASQWSVIIYIGFQNLAWNCRVFQFYCHLKSGNFEERGERFELIFGRLWISKMCQNFITVPETDCWKDYWKRWVLQLNEKLLAKITKRLIKKTLFLENVQHFDLLFTMFIGHETPHSPYYNITNAINSAYLIWTLFGIKKLKSHLISNKTLKKLFTYEYHWPFLTYFKFFT